MTQKKQDAVVLKNSTDTNNATAFFKKESVQAKFQELLGKRSQSFITSVLQVVNSNDKLKNAETNSLYNAVCTAAVLDLPLNNSLGFAYIVPYNTKQSDGTYKVVAQFQLGYKAYIQLAQRSGQFKTISATPIYEGQISDNNPLTGIEFDFSKKHSDKVIGYASYFKLLNGFEKTLYLTVEEIKKHGVKYSKTFNDKYGLWQTDFEGMAIKTVVKLLLSKYAPLSVEMQKAVVIDQSEVQDFETQEVRYVDNEVMEVDKEKERITLLVSKAETIDELDSYKEYAQDSDVMDLFSDKYNELKNN
jgi:recombination protein RecT